MTTALPCVPPTTTGNFMAASCGKFLSTTNSPQMALSPGDFRLLIDAQEQKQQQERLLEILKNCAAQTIAHGLDNAPYVARCALNPSVRDASASTATAVEALTNINGTNSLLPLELARIQLLLNSAVNGQRTLFPLPILSSSGSTLSSALPVASANQPLNFPTCLASIPAVKNLNCPLVICTNNSAPATSQNDIPSGDVDGIQPGFKPPSVSFPSAVRSNESSSNFLHQLLSGADLAQVRTRSGLIEPKLCTRISQNERPSALSGNMSPKTECTDGDRLGASSSSIAGSEHSSTVSHPSPRSSLSPPVGSPMDVQLNPSTALGERRSSGAGPITACPFSSIVFTEKLLALLTQYEAVTVKTTTVPTTTTDGNSPVVILTSTSAPNDKLQPTTHTSEAELNRSMNKLDKDLSEVYPNCLRHLLTTNIPTSTPNRHVPTVTLPCSLGNGPVNTAACMNSSGLLENLKSTSFPSHSATTAPPSDCLASPYESRPRSHSDLHNDTRYRTKHQQFYRPRSQSKTEKHEGVHPKRLTEIDEAGFGLESSLFARLILTPDSPPPHTNEKFRLLNTTPRSRLRCPSSSHSSVASPPAQSVSGEQRSPNLLMPTVTCQTQARTQVFEWLRELDLFVAEHCFDIPLGALLATAISPGRSCLSDICSAMCGFSSGNPIPCATKHVVAKLWHQLLLISMIEHNFTPLISDETTPNTTPTVPCDRNQQGNEYWKNRLDITEQPMRDKLMNAISSLAALDADDSPAPDYHWVDDLRDLVAAGNRLGLTSAVYKLMRFCVLAQNAYPRHFSTTCPEAIAELEAELKRSHSGSPALFVDVLKLLYRLQCFDAGTLKQFFNLSFDPAPTTASTASDPSSNPMCLVSAFPGQQQQPQLLVEPPTIPLNWKRKAVESDSLHGIESDVEMSPVQTRARAYTTSSCSKSARLSSHEGEKHEKPRPRSDTMPTDLWNDRKFKCNHR
ncbi:unnamed protein product [Calicophoron daubneyi]|uniref:Uncharacterized protein n=1 Tax=Calicophoron daubneyi TaxID=300641 RepID=A0AAV2T3V9_CALDB